MKRFERLGWVSLAAVICNAAVWVTVEGCGPDNNGNDAGDGSSDQTTGDVKLDVVPDVAKDGGGGDVTTVDAAAIEQFREEYAAALCKRMSSCCYGLQLDASAPDAEMQTCHDFTVGPQGGGFENAIGDLANPTVLNGGHIAVDSTAKASCLAGLATMSCPNITGSEYATLAQNCVGALTGTIPNGQTGCHASIECADGYCKMPGPDAGPDASTEGTCVPLATQGQACDPTGQGNTQCMYRGWLGSQQLRCDISGNVEAGTCAFGTPTYTCMPKTTTGGTCFFEWECASNTCANDCTCVANTQTWPAFSGLCPTFFGQDSGLSP